MSLRFRFLVSLMLLTSLVSSCQKESQQEGEIKQKLAFIAQSEERQDSEALGALFAEDATFINLTSKETVEGQANILAYLKTRLHTEEKPKVAIKTESIEFEEPSKAISKGTLDLNFPSGEKESLAFKAEFQKVNDSWLVQKWTEISTLAPPSQYEHLKELEWFVGKWSNHDEDTTFTTRNRWDKHKNFLIQVFALTVLGHKQLYGKQIIGWDPREEKIRSWVFDSEGGYGESRWVQDDDSWYVSARYTLPDGSLASATHIYTKVDDNTYKFSSVGRDIDGEVLPNIGPFTVTKK